MTRVLRPLKQGEGGHAPLCEMVESTQAQVYEALGYYMHDTMTQDFVKKLSDGSECGRYIVKLDDGRTVATNPFVLQHPSGSQECINAYISTHPSLQYAPNESPTSRSLSAGIVRTLLDGLIHFGNTLFTRKE